MPLLTLPPAGSEPGCDHLSAQHRAWHIAGITEGINPPIQSWQAHTEGEGWVIKIPEPGLSLCLKDLVKAFLTLGISFCIYKMKTMDQIVSKASPSETPLPPLA